MAHARHLNHISKTNINIGRKSGTINPGLTKSKLRIFIAHYGTLSSPVCLGNGHNMK